MWPSIGVWTSLRATALLVDSTKDSAYRPISAASVGLRRSKRHVSVHCYEATEVSSLIELSNVKIVIWFDLEIVSFRE